MCRCCECKYFEIETTGGYECNYILLCGVFKDSMGKIYLGWEDYSRDIEDCMRNCEHFEKDENKKGEWWL